jgi:hypothetical protein
MDSLPEHSTLNVDRVSCQLFFHRTTPFYLSRALRCTASASRPKPNGQTQGKEISVFWISRGLNPGGGRDFPHPSRPALRPTQPPTQCVLCLSRGVKRPGSGADHPPLSRTEIKERVKLYLYLWVFVAWYRVDFTFTFTRSQYTVVF